MQHKKLEKSNLAIQKETRAVESRLAKAFTMVWIIRKLFVCRALCAIWPGIELAGIVPPTSYDDF